MPNASSIVWGRRIGMLTLVGVVMVSLVGCESTSNWLKGRKTHDADELDVAPAVSDQYVLELSSLIHGDPATQAEIYADSKAAAQLTPGPSTSLRFALVVATPGHPESDDLEAQSLLRELTSQNDLLDASESALATVALNDVERRLVLGAESRRLRTAAPATSNTEDAALAKHVANVEAENRRLRQSLEEAENKLDAITSIERSVRDQ